LEVSKLSSDSKKKAPKKVNSPERKYKNKKSASETRKKKKRYIQTLEEMIKYITSQVVSIQDMSCTCRSQKVKKRIRSHILSKASSTKKKKFKGEKKLLGDLMNICNERPIDNKMYKDTMKDSLPNNREQKIPAKKKIHKRPRQVALMNTPESQYVEFLKLT
jgi:hypothetical protein